MTVILCCLLFHRLEAEGLLPWLAGQGRRSLALPILVFSSKEKASHRGLGLQPMGCKELAQPSTHTLTDQGSLAPVLSHLLFLADPKSGEIILMEVGSHALLSLRLCQLRGGDTA